MDLYIGCSGWSYEGWKGNFYPTNLDNKKWLSYYSKFFKFVEVDSTFYHIPSRFVVKGWHDKTPDDFKFTLKFPKAITHDKRLDDVSKYLYPFFYSLEPLLEKTLSLLMQLPPYFSKEKGFDLLKNLIPKLDNRFSYALEVRESSWFDDKVYSFLKENDISLVWSVRDELKTPPIITTYKQIYIRFIGDRSIDERDFGRVVKNRKREMMDYIDILENKDKNILNEQKHERKIIIAFNNHFAGFGPQSANDFLKLINKPVINWKTSLLEQKDLKYSFDRNNVQQQQTKLFGGGDGNS